MQVIHKKSLYPKPILIALDYIYDNLHTKITLQDLAEATQLSPSHLSKLFHKEMDLTISSYIRKKRIEAAEKSASHRNSTGKLSFERIGRYKKEIDKQLHPISFPNGITSYRRTVYIQSNF